MRKCPKCSMEYDDDRKICRACGSALDDYVPPPVEAVPPAPVVEPLPILDEPILAEFAEEVAKPRHSWTCQGCGKLVPVEFTVCWNCGADEQGQPDSGFVVEPKDDWKKLERKLIVEAEEIKTNEPHCPKCGSKKIIPRTRVRDQGQYSNGHLQVVVCGDPNALLFKDRLLEDIIADVCGDCGFIELKVKNPGELYEHYLHAKPNTQRYI